MSGVSNLINQIRGIFSAQLTVPQFVIYTSAILDPAPDAVTNVDLGAIRFNSLKDIAYKQSVNVAYEPLEAGSFSSDSKQGTPYTLFLTGIVAPFATSSTFSNADYRNALSEVAEQLDTYVNSIELLTIIKNRPLFAQYSPLTLTSVSYDLTQDHNYLKAYLSFQEVRMTTSTQYGSLAQNQVSNPTSTSTVTTGNQAPITPPANTFNTLGNPANG